MACASPSKRKSAFYDNAGVTDIPWRRRLLFGTMVVTPPMTTGLFLTRSFIWLALIAYALAIGLMILSPGHPGWRTRARGAWTFGCATFLAHVLCAFAYFHHWSHTEAYRETARQTAALTGRAWGGGIYFNYLLAALWIADVSWWWLGPQSFDQRPRWLTIAWHAFFFFIVFNGTIVFGHGPVRVLGVDICLVPLACGWYRWRHRTVVR